MAILYTILTSHIHNPKLHLYSSYVAANSIHHPTKKVTHLDGLCLITRPMDFTIRMVGQRRLDDGTVLSYTEGEGNNGQESGEQSKRTGDEKLAMR